MLSSYKLLNSKTRPFLCYLFKLSDSASVLRCFPPSTLGATSNDHQAYFKKDSADLADLADIADLADSNRLADCAPQESPVAEAGPGVSYPGYKQYCR